MSVMWSHEILSTELTFHTKTLTLIKILLNLSLQLFGDNIDHFQCALTPFHSNTFLFSQLEVTPNFNENATP